MSGELLSLCTDADRERFADVCHEVAVAGQGDYSGNETGIGVLNEKRLHAAIKRFVCADSSCHEQRPITIAGTKAKKYVADLLCGDEIYEIQTGSFLPLRKKLEWYAKNTDCHITVVHPIAARRRIVWIDPESGEATPSTRRAPAKRAADILHESVYISELIASGRVGLRLLLIEAEEYRFQNGWGNGGKRGSTRFEMLPTALVDTIALELPEDFYPLLPQSLCQGGFTAAEFARIMKFPSRKAYLALRTLENLGLVRSEREKRPAVFSVV